MADNWLKTFWAELRRRKVIRAALVYVLVAWVVVETSSVVLPGLLLPEWSVRLVLALAILGFPLVLVLAWALELTPEGLQRETPKPTDAGFNFADARIPMDDYGLPGQAAGPEADRRKAVAVLPLANLSGDPENEYFSDGITEEILNLLSKQPELRVVSRTSSFVFKKTQLDVPSIAKKLGVDIVLEGSVRRAGNRVRITAQLIDAASDSHLWAETYDREMEDIFAVQTNIANCIVDAMNLQTKAEVECDCTTADVDAYEYYLRGRYYFYQMTQLTQEFAGEMFRKAIEIDPTFARAYAGLADSESMIAQWIERTPEHMEAADRASRKALELAPELPESHASRGFALSINGEYEEAAENFEKALQLDPDHYDSLYLYGRARYAQGNIEHAVELWRRAHDVQPDEFQSIVLSIGGLKSLGRKDDAQTAAEESFVLIKRRLELNPDDRRALSLGPAVLIELGRIDEALSMVDKAIAISPNDGAVLHNAACAYAQAGRKEKALELLERRMNAAGTINWDWIEHDPDFDILRGEPRFLALRNDQRATPDNPASG